MTFGQRIRELRREQHLTLREMADKLQEMGLRADFTYLSKIENDRIEFTPSEELIRGMAKILETDPEELLDFAGKFNQRTLQEVVVEMPEAGILLRRLQTKKVTRNQLERIQQILNETED